MIKDKRVEDCAFVIVIISVTIIKIVILFKGVIIIINL
jgi:hypothetical protein